MIRRVKRWWNSQRGRISRDDLYRAAGKAGLDYLDPVAANAVMEVLITTERIAVGEYTYELPNGEEVACPIYQAGLGVSNVVWATDFDKALHNIGAVSWFRHRVVYEVID